MGEVEWKSVRKVENERGRRGNEMKEGRRKEREK